MTRTTAPARGRRFRHAGAAWLLACAWRADGAEFAWQFGGRITYGEVWRVQGRDPDLLTGVNAAAIGLTGTGSGGNADDGNTNYARFDAASRAVKGVFELQAGADDWSAALRVKAWRDVGLLHDARPWGNVANGYAPDRPLSDAGAPRRSRFSGVALLEAWVQGRAQLGQAEVVARVGQQSLDWGTRMLSPGGLEALNPRDLPGLRRAGAVPAEGVVPRPLLFLRAALAPGFAIEAYHQARFRANAYDMCGTLWSMNDYLTEGCDKVMTGMPVTSDRARIPLGAWQKRLPTPAPGGSEFGVAASWRLALAGARPDTVVGLYHARYISRAAFPAVRRSTRVGGPGFIAGDPDGLNMAYRTEYPEGLRISALTLAHTRASTTLLGELSYRPRLPLMLAPADVIPPFLNDSMPALLRARVDAVAPGAIFQGWDLHPMWQLQLGVRREATLAGVSLALGAEAVLKRVPGLPDTGLLRYGRPDIFGVGPVNGACFGGTGNPARQCSDRGYVSPSAWGYRLRLDARLPALGPQWTGTASALLAHDVNGWAGDFQLSEGRRSLALALRLEYRGRYLVECGYHPAWGGDYNASADRDTASLALGVKF